MIRPRFHVWLAVGVEQRERTHGGDNSQIALRKSTRFAGTDDDLVEHVLAEFADTRAESIVRRRPCHRVRILSVQPPRRVVEEF